MADLETAKRLGFKYRKFVVTLDKRTSKICHKHDGELVKTEGCEVGINTPPMHPYCRSIMVDIDPDWYEMNNGELKIYEKKNPENENSSTVNLDKTNEREYNGDEHSDEQESKENDYNLKIEKAKEKVLLFGKEHNKEALIWLNEQGYEGIRSKLEQQIKSV